MIRFCSFCELFTQFTDIKGETSPEADIDPIYALQTLDTLQQHINGARERIG